MNEIGKNVFQIKYKENEIFGL